MDTHLQGLAAVSTVVAASALQTIEMPDAVGVPATILLPAVVAVAADATGPAVLTLPQGNGLVNRQTQVLQEQC